MKRTGPRRPHLSEEEDEYEFQDGPQIRVSASSRANVNGGMRLRERRPEKPSYVPSEFEPTERRPRNKRHEDSDEDEIGDSEEEFVDFREPKSYKRSLRTTRGTRTTFESIRREQEIDKELDRMGRALLIADAEDELRCIEAGMNEEDDDEKLGIFNPGIEQILWRRVKPGSDPPTIEYYVKLQDYSYLHCAWVDHEEAINLSRSTKQKVNRFNKQFDQKIIDKEIDPYRDDVEYHDPSYLKVDRVLDTADIFPVIRSKKANEIVGKWSEYAAVLVSRLLNYSKDNVHYGVYFREPVDPEKDNCPDYRKVVTHPVDLGTLINRIYLDQYKNFGEIFRDLGFVFKNCRAYNKIETSEIRILCDTLREYARILYGKWHFAQLERFNSISNENQQKKEELIQKHPEKQQEIASLFQQETTATLEALGQFLDKGLDAIEKSENGVRIDRESLKSCKAEFGRVLSENLVLFGLDQNFWHQITREVDRILSLSIPSAVARPEASKILALLTDKNQNCASEIIRLRLEDFLSQEYRLLSTEEVAKYHPGDMSYNWLKDFDATAVEEEDFCFFDPEEIDKIRLLDKIDRVFLVKWVNVSYTQVSWELESIIDCPELITEFKMFNRALDKDTRATYTDLLQKHKELLEIVNDPKKRARVHHQTRTDMRNKLYHLDVSRKEELFQYNQKNQPIFKQRKMLRSYQLESLNWLIESWYNCRNVILADEMGLGKTIQSIAFLNYLFSVQNMKGPFLVLAPLSTLQHWKRTVDEWSTMNGVLYHDNDGAEGRAACRNYEWNLIDVKMKGSLVRHTELCKFNILITSFEVFQSDSKDILELLPFQHIIIDEAHRLKNQNAKILTALKKLPCERILLLTGTPIQNNTSELWTLLNFIEGEKFWSLDSFKQDFGDFSTTEQVDKFNIMLKPYLLRRMKDDVEKSIPALEENFIDVELTTLQKTLYKALYDNKKSLLVKGLALPTALNNLEMQLRKCCNHPYLVQEESQTNQMTEADYLEKLVSGSSKMVLLDKLLEKYLKEEGKVLIFSQFTQMLSLIGTYLKSRAISFEKIDGGVKAKERQNAIDRFNAPGSKISVFLLSTKAGGVGINLTSASVVIIYDSDWNPQNDVQATARAHRIGQEKEVKVYRFLTKNTYEAAMFERASKKLGLDQAIFQRGAFQGKNSINEETDIQKKTNAAEIELLLRKGIVGLFDEADSEPANGPSLADMNIDELLNNSRVAKFSLVKGTYTFAKSSVAATQQDMELQMSDPDFWQKVFKDSETEAEKLSKYYSQTENSGGFTQDQFQRELIIKLSKLVSNLIDSKIKIGTESYSVDDESRVNEILAQVSSHPLFHKQYKDIAHQMITELQKPSRRARNLDLSRLELTLGQVPASGMAAPTPTVHKPQSKLSQAGKTAAPVDVDEDGIYRSDDDEGDTNKVFTKTLQKQGLLKKKPKLPELKPQADHSKHEEGMIESQTGELVASGDKGSKVKSTASLGILTQPAKKAKPSGQNGVEKPKQAKTDKLSEERGNVKSKEAVSKSETLKSGGNTAKAKVAAKAESSEGEGESRASTENSGKDRPKKVVGSQLKKRKAVGEGDGEPGEEEGLRTDSAKAKASRSQGKEKAVKTEKAAAKEAPKSGSVTVAVAPKAKVLKYNYEQIGLAPPSTFDYSLYNKDWCRYCGARYSHSFQSGPWGKKTLCQTHFEVKSKLKLSIKDYPELTAPIEIEASTELEYFSEFESLQDIKDFLARRKSAQVLLKR